jgi:hypothetical protein
MDHPPTIQRHTRADLHRLINKLTMPIGKNGEAHAHSEDERGSRGGRRRENARRQRGRR